MWPSQVPYPNFIDSDFILDDDNVAHPGALPSHSKILTSSRKREMWPLWVPYSQQHDFFNCRGNVALPGALLPIPTGN